MRVGAGTIRKSYICLCEGPQTHETDGYIERGGGELACSVCLQHIVNFRSRNSVSHGTKFQIPVRLMLMNEGLRVTSV